MSTGDYRIERDGLLARVDLAQLLDALTTGHGHGRRRTWNCPDRDHPDVHPSVTVHTTARGVERWKCWSGDHGGTAIDAVVAARRLPVGDAIRWLNDNYARLDPVDRKPPAPGRPIGAPAPEVIEYVERCAKLLWTGSGRQVREWLNARGYSDEILALNKVGADPGRRYLPRPKGFPGGWPAAVYPALDRHGAITYFQVRYLHPPDGRGKYDNPSRRWAANPRLGWVRPIGGGIGGPLVVCEGIADALAVAEHGCASVGVLGTELVHRRVAAELARGAHDGVVVCFDADEAGQHGAHRLLDELHRCGVGRARNVVPPNGLDATEWLLHGSTALERQARVDLGLKRRSRFELEFGMT
jgi:hypothetical protein